MELGITSTEQLTEDNCIQPSRVGPSLLNSVEGRCCCGFAFNVWNWDTHCQEAHSLTIFQCWPLTLHPWERCQLRESSSSLWSIIFKIFISVGYSWPDSVVLKSRKTLFSWVRTWEIILIVLVVIILDPCVFCFVKLNVCGMRTKSIFTLFDLVMRNPGYRSIRRRVSHWHTRTTE
jgi:hypothetical protein